MQTASDIIQSFGGAANLARETGIPLTTIIGWRDANFIPEWRQSTLISQGKKRDPKVVLTRQDFPSAASRIPSKDRSCLAARKVAQKVCAAARKGESEKAA